MSQKKALIKSGPETERGKSNNEFQEEFKVIISL